MSLSIILSCYNEVPSIFETYRRIASMMALTRIDHEFIIVDDGSSGSVKEELRRHFSSTGDVKLIISDTNEGRGAAITKGIMAASLQYAGFIDTDLEIPEHSIFDLYNAIASGPFDVAIGKRTYLDMATPMQWLRYLASRFYYSIANNVLGLMSFDSETGVKIFRRDRFLPVLDRIQDKRWFWDTEAVSESIRAGLRIVQVPVFVLRKGGKRSSVRLFSDSVKYIRAIYSYRKRLNAK